MSPLAPALIRAAFISAALTSSIAVTDAATVALTGHGSIFAGEGPDWAGQLSSAMHGVMFALLAAVLVTTGSGIDAGSRVRRWVRRVLVALFVLLAVPQLVGGFVPLDRIPEWLTLPITAAFILAFPVSGALGLTLLRRPQLRLPAVMLTAVLVALVLLVALGALGWAGAHPALAEVPQYLGVALLGQRVASSRAAEVAALPPRGVVTA